MRVFGLSLVVLLGCAKPGPARCPSADAVAEIHAAAFFFQQDSLSRAQLRLSEAKRLSGPRSAQMPATSRVLDELDALAALAPDAGDERAQRAEAVRARLSEWECLPAATHEALHRDLPPLPGAR